MFWIPPYPCFLGASWTWSPPFFSSISFSASSPGFFFELLDLEADALSALDEAVFLQLAATLGFEVGFKVDFLGGGFPLLRFAQTPLKA